MDPSRLEMMQSFEDTCFSKDAAEEAIFWFANDYYSGQASNLYAAVCASAFKPGTSARGPEGEALEAYNHLEQIFVPSL